MKSRYKIPSLIALISIIAIGIISVQSSQKIETDISSSFSNTFSFEKIIQDALETDNNIYGNVENHDETCVHESEPTDIVTVTFSKIKNISNEHDPDYEKFLTGETSIKVKKGCSFKYVEKPIWFRNRNLSNIKGWTKYTSVLTPISAEEVIESDITLYPIPGEEKYFTTTFDLSQNLYDWFGESDFAKLTSSKGAKVNNTVSNFYNSQEEIDLTLINNKMISLNGLHTHTIKESKYTFNLKIENNRVYYDQPMCNVSVKLEPKKTQEDISSSKTTTLINGGNINTNYKYDTGNHKLNITTDSNNYKIYDIKLDDKSVNYGQNDLISIKEHVSGKVLYVDMFSCSNLTSSKTIETEDGDKIKYYFTDDDEMKFEFTFDDRGISSKAYRETLTDDYGNEYVSSRTITDIDDNGNDSGRFYINDLADNRNYCACFNDDTPLHSGFTIKKENLTEDIVGSSENGFTITANITIHYTKTDYIGQHYVKKWNQIIKVCTTTSFSGTCSLCGRLTTLNSCGYCIECCYSDHQAKKTEYVGIKTNVDASTITTQESENYQIIFNIPSLSLPMRKVYTITL